MSWHLIEKILEEAGKHSTWLGKLWILALFFFRVLVITRIGDTVYHDEQAAFRCNNRQPGCENVCFSAYSPISFIRFSAFQVICVALPSVCYILYSAHVVAMNRRLNPTGAQNSVFKVKMDRKQIKLQSQGINPGGLHDKSKKDPTGQIGFQPKIFQQGDRLQFTHSVSSQNIGKFPPNSMQQASIPSLMPISIQKSMQNSMQNSCKRRNLSQGLATKCLHYDPPPYNFQINTNLLPIKAQTPAHPLKKTKPIRFLPSKVQKYCTCCFRSKKQINSNNSSHEPFRPNSPSGSIRSDVFNNDGIVISENKTNNPHQNLQVKKQQEYLKKHACPVDRMMIDAKIIRRKLSRAYTFHAITRCVMEVLFCLVQYKQFPLVIKPLYKCNQWPCPNVVDCFPSRPREKTFVSQFLMLVTVFCVIVNILDLHWIGYKRIIKAFQRRKEKTQLNGKLVSSNDVIKMARAGNARSEGLKNKGTNGFPKKLDKLDMKKTGGIGSPSKKRSTINFEQ